MGKYIAGWVCWCLLGFAVGAEAETVVYTFESPDFTLGEYTPLLSRQPQQGSSAFRATFTSLPTANGIGVAGIQVSPLFSGQSLMDPYPPPTADTLRVTVNTPITALQVDFALFQPDHLRLTSSAGSISAPVLPETQWGTLSFSSTVPFTQFDLQGFDPSNQPTQLAIDNLRMTVVPEPSALTLVAFACGWFGLWGRRPHARR